MNTFKNERLKNQGRLLESKQKKDALELRLKNLVRTIRECADPLEALADIPGEEMVQHALNFSQRQIEYIGVCREIETIETALGH